MQTKWIDLKHGKYYEATERILDWLTPKISFFVIYLKPESDMIYRKWIFHLND